MSVPEATRPLGRIVLSCEQLQETVDWFVAEAGFRLDMITPADAPKVAELSGHGLSITLDVRASPHRATLRLPTDAQERAPIHGPNGTTIEWFAVDGLSLLAENVPQFVLSRIEDANFGDGRAGMQYRDLIPERQGGRYIASHINIRDGGPVPDYVHHHDIRFQMIFCHAGWAKLVYEDQGEPFIFEAGDCVLQPPHIRHQVLETSEAFEVVEISSPAEHPTFRDHELTLPTDELTPNRLFNGQRFVWHRGAEAAWQSSRFDGFEIQEFAITSSTNGLASVARIRANSASELRNYQPNDEFAFWFVRSGSATLVRNQETTHHIRSRDSVTLMTNETYALHDVSNDFELLEVRVAERPQI